MQEESIYLLIAILINEENKNVHIRTRDTGNLQLSSERAYAERSFNRK